MKRYAQIVNEETKQCEVGIGTDSDFYKSIGMTEMEVEQSYNGDWYVQGYAPQKPQSVKEQEVRDVRNLYLVKYVDPKQLVLVWDSLTEEEKNNYSNYRQYLLDYTEEESWWEKNPMTFDEWKSQQGE